MVFIKKIDPQFYTSLINKYNYLHVDFLSCNHMKLTYYLKENLVFFGFSPYVTI